MLYIRNAIVLIFAALSFSVFAQKDKEAIKGGEVVVDATYKATLLQSEKIKTGLSLPSLDTTTKVQEYSISSRSFKVEYLPPKLRPVAMGSEKKEQGDVKNGYVKAGYGVPSAPYLDASYAFNKDKLRAIASVNHYSIRSGKNELMRYGNTGGNVSGNYYVSKNYAVNANMGYNQETPRYYALRDTTVATETTQQLKTFTFGAGIFNTANADRSFTYGASMNFYRLADNFASSEIGTVVQGNVTKWFADKHPLSVLLKGDFTNYSSTETSGSERLNNLFVQPSFTFHGKAFSLQAGANLASVSDEWTPFPMLELSVNVLGERLAAFAGWKGDLQKNNFKSLTDYNPFLNTHISTFLPLNQKLSNASYYDYFGGVKGHSGKLDYHVQAGFKTIQNLALYRNNKAVEDSLTFSAVYTDANVTYLKGAVTMEIAKDLELTAMFVQNIFSMKDSLVSKPWGLPSTDLNAMVKYRVLDRKLGLKGQMFFQNGIPYVNPITNKNDKLGALLDISFGTEYNINDKFSVWLDVNNVLNNKRQRWYRYPSFGTNVIGGLKVKF